MILRHYSKFFTKHSLYCSLNKTNTNNFLYVFFYCKDLFYKFRFISNQTLTELFILKNGVKLFGKTIIFIQKHRKPNIKN